MLGPDQDEPPVASGLLPEVNNSNTRLNHSNQHNVTYNHASLHSETNETIEAVGFSSQLISRIH